MAFEDQLWPAFVAGVLVEVVRMLFCSGAGAIRNWLDRRGGSRYVA